MSSVDRYCPFNGFNPPCHKCMWAIRYDDIVACSIVIIATRGIDDLMIENFILDEEGADEDQGADEGA